MKIGELKTLLTENKINFYTYWNKKRLIALANEHDLLPKIEVKKEENSKDAKYDRLKTIGHNPRKVTLEDVETGEIKTFPSIKPHRRLHIGQGRKDLGIINTRFLSNNFYYVYLKNVIKLWFF